jgi:phytanoyl-CoA hydroxylase
MTAVAVVSTLGNAVENFRRDGYLHIRSFFNKRQTAGMLSNVKRYIDEVMPGLPATEKFFAERDDANTLFRLEKLDQHDDWFDRLNHDDRVTSLIKQLLDDDLFYQRVALFAKLPDGGEATPPHQDGYYFKLTPNEAITCWLPLDPANPSNGGIRYVPGSHLGPIRDHVEGETYGFSLGIKELTETDLQAEVAIDAEPGDLVLHHAMTIHRAEANNSSNHRRAIGLIYFAKRAQTNEQATIEHDEKLNKKWTEAGRR